MQRTDSEYSCIQVIAGVDEVGRGPLAGPVVAAAVVLDDKCIINGLQDSKMLSEKKRQSLADEIRKKAISWGIGRADIEEIDKLNILQASLLAMQRAVKSLNISPDCVLVDGIHAPILDCQVQTFVKGDQLIPAISAASIIAKVNRDNEMIEMDKYFPGYGFARHKGYPTKQHIKAIEDLGVCAIHRRSFRPIRSFYENN